MKKSEKKGFHTVESNTDELDEKIYEHRKSIFWKSVRTVCILVVVLVAFGLWTALRTFTSFDVRNSIERTDSEASSFESFLENIVKYSNDGIVYMDDAGELIWNQSFEMSAPKLSICENYLAVYDRGGMEIYIMNESGVKNRIETNRPIQKVCVANQGTVAVLMKEGTTSYLKLYDQNGAELANGEFYGNKGGFPIDIAFSYDAQKLAVDMVDVSDGSIKSTINFYNFGSVGQNEINNNVGTYSFSDMLIPEIRYVSSDRMVAFGDSEIIIFTGSQKPQISKEIFFENEIQSVFCNESYIGVVQSNYDEAGTHHIRVFDMRGNEVMSGDTGMAYREIEFLDNNEICVRNQYECQLFTVHSVRKFEYTFDNELYKVISRNGGTDYILVLDGVTEEVHLK